MAESRVQKDEVSKKHPGGRPKTAWNGSRIRTACKLYTFTSLTMEEIVKVLELLGFSPNGRRSVETTIFKILPKIPNRLRSKGRWFVTSWAETRKCRQQRKSRRERALSTSYRQFPSSIGSLSQTSSTATEIASEDGNIDFQASYAEAIGLQLLCKIYYDSTWLQVQQTSVLPERHFNQTRSICSSTSVSGRSSMTSWRSSLESRNSQSTQARDPFPEPNEPNMGVLWGNVQYTTSSLLQNSIPFTLYADLAESYRIKKAKNLLAKDVLATSRAVLDGINALERLTKDEQEVWNEIIDERQFEESTVEMSESTGGAHGAGRPSLYQFLSYHLSPYRRGCGNCSSDRLDKETCKKCGSSWLQRRYRYDIFRGYFYGGGPAESASYRDYFDNTPLHYAAENTSTNFCGISRLIIDGCDINAKNTNGATFMHVMDWAKFEPFSGSFDGRIKELVHLLGYLSFKSFHFGDRDYHGQTVAYKAFISQPAPHGADINISKIVKVFSLMTPDVDPGDILGRSIRLVMRKWIDELRNASLVNGAEKVAILERLLRRKGKATPHYTFRKLYTGIVYPYIKSSWTNSDDHVNYIDVNGDTLLFGVLKTWHYMLDEAFLKDEILELIDAGAEIHQRDSKGNTALVVSTRMGLPSIVELLLSKGANANTESFKTLDASHNSGSLLCQAERYLARAKHQKDKSQYAKILYCIKLVTDAGAVAEPSPFQIWASEGVRKAGNYS